MEARQGSDQASNFILAGGVIYVQRERGSRLMGGSGVAREAGRTLGGSAFQGLVDSDRISPKVCPALRALGPSISSLSVLEGGR